VPVLELAGRRRACPDLRVSVDLVLGLATFSAIGAAVLGWCLARSGAYSGALVTQHMWGGVFVAALCWLCWMLHVHGPDAGRRLDFMYPIGLAVAAGLVLWTGYRGGQLSQGQNHLTEHMPPMLRDWLGLPEQDKGPTAAPPTSFFSMRVEPVFAQHCISCHGRSKKKSGLRLDRYETVMRGGKSGLVVKAGNPLGSELFHRVTLPEGSDKIMPPEGKPRLSADEVKLLELWISAGASATLEADAIKGAPSSTESSAREVGYEEISAAAVRRLRAPLAPTLARLQERYPDVLQDESRGSADVVLNVSLMGGKFGDVDLAALQPLYGQIVVADLSGTAVTDRSAAAIAAMKRLRVLRLMHTKITDSTLQAVGGLDQLESISVFDTAVTAAALQVIGRLPKLQHLYAGETEIRPGVRVSEAMKDKVSF